MYLLVKLKVLGQHLGIIESINTRFIMRLSMLITLVLLVGSTAMGFSQRITLNLKETKIETAFKEIEKKTGYRFIYERDMLKNTSLVTTSFHNLSLEEAMNQILEGQSLDYTIRDKYIVISSKSNSLPSQQVAGNNKNTVVRTEQASVAGVVRDSLGNALIGVSIINKSKPASTQTDHEGRFTISGNSGDVLEFSFIGFVTSRVTLTGQPAVQVTLKQEDNVLDAVVVTALGIRKSTKALTYNVQEVKAEELTKVPDASLVNALSGKVAGVTINSSASGIGGSTRVVMRGDKSIFGNNNTLYVLDGIPLPNLFSKSNRTPNGVFGGGDDGDGISNLNPEDFESVTVLTGAASAALYGTQAANGAVLLTTKKGRSDRTAVSISNNTSFFNPFVLPRFQNKYGTSSSGAFDSWGDELAEPSSFHPKDFFQTGTNAMNNVSLSTGNDKNQTYFSAATLNAKGIVPNNDIERYNITLRNGTTLLNDRLNLDFNFMYVKSKNQNMISQGQYFNPLVPLYLFPRGDDIDKYKVFERYNPERNFQTQFWPYGPLGIAMQNPYWIINRNFRNNNKDRFVVGGSVKYSLLDWLDLSSRIRIDNNFNLHEVKNHASTYSLLTANSDNGSYLNSNERTRQTYIDFLASANKNFNDFGLAANLGASILHTNYGLTGNSVDGNGAGLAIVPNLFTLNNTIPAPALQEGFKEQNQAIFGTVQFNYKGSVFLDLTARNEWASPLANTQKLSFFYPSAGLSVILSDMISIPKDIVSLLKIRGAYSEVGNSIPRFISMEQYPVSPSGISLNPNMPLTDLEPERTKAAEVGINARFLKNRINLDVTLYQTNTFNQLFTFQAPAGTGVANYFVNAGRVENRGLEAAVGYDGQFGQLGWNSTLTFTLNRNKIRELVENKFDPFTGQPFDIERFDMGGTGSYQNFIYSGGSLGDFHVNKLMTDLNGYIFVHPSTNDVEIDNVNLIKGGNTNPRYNIGFRNSFQYKNFNLGFLIDTRLGGEVVSATQALMDGYGTSATTAFDREEGGALVNGYRLGAQRFYEKVGLGSGVLSRYVYDATNVRLREASLSYTIPTTMLGNRIKDLTVSVIGRNLFMLYNKAPFDPETTSSTGTYFQGIDYFMFPSLRSYGFGVRLNF